jgi:hypothetical protein
MFACNLIYLEGDLENGCGGAETVGEKSPLHSLTGLPRSLGLLLQSVYRLFQASAGSRVDGVTIKETLHRMLGSSRLSHELSQSKTSGSGDGPGISGTSFNSLTRVIFDGSAILQNTDIFTFLRSSLNLFPDKNERRHCLNGPPQQ